MEILKAIILVLHLLSFGAMFGVAIAQFRPAAEGKGTMSKGLQHSGWALLATGLLLVGMVYAVGSEPNNFKIGVKLVVLLAIMGVVLMNRNRTDLRAGTFGALVALLGVNVALAVIW